MPVWLQAFYSSGVFGGSQDFLYIGHFCYIFVESKLPHHCKWGVPPLLLQLKAYFI
jgi:hypothetical protein